MSRESVLSKIVVCPRCRTSYLPDNGEICKCEATDAAVDFLYNPEADKQSGWHDKLTERDHV